MNACLDDETVAALLRGDVSPALESSRVHLFECDTCQDLVALAAPRGGLGTGDVIAERFRVGTEIGRGGMGVVYRAWDEKLARELAIKVLHSADPSAHDRMNREAQMLARLSHPNIVTVFDVAVHAGQLCMVMELAAGRSLRAWLAAKPERDAILDVLSKAGEGLSAAHRAGIVHRDFKSENVMVGADGQVKVCDFGLAQGDVVAESAPSTEASLPSDLPLRRLTRTGKVVGTPAYMAPEQFAGRDASERSDQFAFAVCAWEALFDAHPFGSETLGGLRRNFGRGPRGAAAGDPIRPALERALERRPEDRHESMAHLLVAMRSAARRPRARRSALLGGAAVLVAGGIAATVASRSTHPSAPLGGDHTQPRVALASSPPASSPPPTTAAPTTTSAPPAPVELAVEPAATSSAAVATSRALPSAPPAPPPRGVARGGTSSDARGAGVARPSSTPKGPNGAPLID